jgi:hypothetical protein
VKHLARKSFWEHYDRLPKKIKALADKDFELLKRDPRHPSLQLKKAGRLWSARVGIDFRALAYDSSAGLVWFWIGPHDEYERYLKSLGG